MTYHLNKFLSTTVPDAVTHLLSVRFCAVLLGAGMCALTACTQTGVTDHRSENTHVQSKAIPARQLATTGSEPGVEVMEGEELARWQGKRMGTASR